MDGDDSRGAGGGPEGMGLVEDRVCGLRIEGILRGRCAEMRLTDFFMVEGTCRYAARWISLHENHAKHAYLMSQIVVPMLIPFVLLTTTVN